MAVRSAVCTVATAAAWWLPPESPVSRLLFGVAYLAGANSLNWASWMLSSLVGIALAHSIPPALGLGFAGILCLLGMQCSLASSRLRILAYVVAGVTAVWVYHLPLRLNIVTAIAVAVMVCMSAERLKPTSAPGGHA